MARWHFRPKLAGETERNPVSGEYFDEVSIERPAQALVREVIQNSLDAIVHGSEDAVHLRFYVSGDSGKLSAESARVWFGGAWQHMTAPDSGLRGIPQQPESCPYLLVEDFGTKGLEGDTAAGDLRPGEAKNHFYAFFRAEGVSENTGGRGTWGVGKTVFARSSRINTFFGLTVRPGNAQPFLMGQTILRYHRLGSTKYAPDGLFGVMQPNDHFVLPVEDQAMIEQFRRDFDVARQEEPGLSVIVPYCLDEITEEMIVQAVGREYFFPILAGKLTVSVDGPDSTRTLDADHLLSLIDADETDLEGDLKALISFAIDAQTLPEVDMIELSAQPSGAAPVWGPPCFPDGTITDIAPRFMRGELLWFRVPVVVRSVDAVESPSHFDFFLRKDLEGTGYPPRFIRNGIIIPKAYSGRVRGQRLFALVIIVHDSLAEFLGNAENPAHTQWSHKSQNFRDKYEDGRATLDFIRSAPRQVAEILSRAQEERDWLALADFFPQLPEDDGIPEPDDPPDAEDGDEPELPPPLPADPTPQPFRIEHIAGGFRVVRDNPEQTGLPTALEINIAYDTSRGNPLKKYNPVDFDLGRTPIRIEVTSAEVIECGANHLQVNLDDDNFRIEASGFDENRDLYVQVKRASNEADQSEGGGGSPESEGAAT